MRRRLAGALATGAVVLAAAPGAGAEETQQIRRMVGSEPVAFKLLSSFNERDWWLFVGGLDPFCEPAGGGVSCSRRGVILHIKHRHVRAVRIFPQAHPSYHPLGDARRTPKGRELRP